MRAMDRTIMQHRPIEICECASPAALRATLAGRRLPLIIRGMIDHWPALERWTPDYLAARCGTLDCDYVAEPRTPVVSRLAAFESSIFIAEPFLGNVAGADMGFEKPQETTKAGGPPSQFVTWVFELWGTGSSAFATKLGDLPSEAALEQH